MKIAMIGSLAVAALVVAGCGDNKGGATSAPAADKAKASAPAKPVDKNEVMVSVNGKKLTRGEIDADVETFIAARKSQIPPEQIEEAKKAIPMKRLGRAEEVASLVGYLFTEAAGYLTRQVIAVNGGMV